MMLSRQSGPSRLFIDNHKVEQVPARDFPNFCRNGFSIQTSAIPKLKRPQREQLYLYILILTYFAAQLSKLGNTFVHQLCL